MRRKDKLDRLRLLLRKETTLALATTCQDGTPHCAPLFYWADEQLHLYWFSSRQSLHSRNCARSPAVAVTVYRNVRHWRQIEGAQMRGAVTIVSARALRASVARAYAARFQLGDLFSAALRRSALYCFTPAWIRWIDNSHGFGAKFELALTAGDGEDAVRFRARPGKENARSIKSVGKECTDG